MDLINSWSFLDFESYKLDEIVVGVFLVIDLCIGVFVILFFFDFFEYWVIMKSEIKIYNIVILIIWIF